ncbi:hypothetical protein [Novosphingobium sp. BW1]|nr:hypothetical protein [Novosphingobium sp. BW1]
MTLKTTGATERHLRRPCANLRSRLPRIPEMRSLLSATDLQRLVAAMVD